MNRLSGYGEISRRFNWRPIIVVYHDCPCVGWAWLWWSGAIWLLPHTKEEQYALLMKSAGEAAPADEEEVNTA